MKFKGGASRSPRHRDVLFSAVLARRGDVLFSFSAASAICQPFVAAVEEGKGANKSVIVDLSADYLSKASGPTVSQSWCRDAIMPRRPG